MGKVKNELWTFCKAQLTAQMATLVDFVVSFLLAAGFGMWYVNASFLGALSGGATNCVANYRWVFSGAHDLKKRWVALKYLLVWTGSILLNTGGTYLLTELSGSYFIFPKTIVAVAIALLWNYPLQRTFVYRDNSLSQRLGKLKDKHSKTENTEE